MNILPNKKIKLLIAISDFYVGGAQRLIAEQIPRFDREKFSLELLLLMRETPPRASLEHTLPPDLPITRVQMRHWYDPRDLFKLIRALRSIRPDVVISHLFLCNMLLRMMQPLVGYRTIPVTHNTYVNKKWWQIFVDATLARMTRTMVMVSQEVADFTMRQQWIPRNRVAIIPNGINLATIDAYLAGTSQALARAKLSIPENATVCIAVGRLTPQKNQKRLVESFHQFSLRHPNARLYLLGEGALRADLEKAAAQNPAIIFAGNVDNVFDYYRAADFLVSTSIIEGMSMAYLEALAFGLPLIATETGGTRELIQDSINGFIIPAGGNDAVIQTLKKAVAADYPTISHAARAKSQEFSIEKNVRAYESLALARVSG